MIGFYDSGIGGLTIAEKFFRLRPNLQTIYLADTVNCPLGNKTDEEILTITKRGVEFLFQAGCNLVILACNTATSLSIRHIQQDWLPKSQYLGKNVLGVIKPVTEELIRQQHYIEPILILATEATCRSEFYQQELRGENFKHYDCLSFKNLAVAIESQNISLIQTSLEDGFKSVDVSKHASFVLACTHYPIAKKQIHQIIAASTNREFQIIDQSELVAEKLNNYLIKHPQFIPDNGDLQVYISQGESGEYSNKIHTLFPEMSFKVNLV